MRKTGYLLINLGTPNTPSTRDVRRYLNEFLMDPYVLDVPWPLRRMIVSTMILPFRPKQSAASYAAIWSADGSPLLLFSDALRQGLEHTLQASVALGMRYGNPSISSAVDKLVHAGAEHLVVVPLYPHHADSTVTTSQKAVRAVLPDGIECSFVPPFYDNPGYIEALATTVRDALPQRWDHLLLSYHGLPERQLTKADPTDSHCLVRTDCCETASAAHPTCYRHQVLATSAALMQALAVDTNQYSVSFQSRLGRLPWLRPYTDQVLAALPTQGVKHLVVACPAFVADNLETLEEMDIRGRQIFLDAGGTSFHLVPCLNDHPTWVTVLAGMLLDTARLGKTDAGYKPRARADTST